MEQQGKYYNPEYPETSNEWTKRWDKSWLLSKDKYLLMYAKEEERVDKYKWLKGLYLLPFVFIVVVFMITIYQLVNLNSDNYYIDIIFLFLACVLLRFPLLILF